MDSKQKFTGFKKSAKTSTNVIRWMFVVSILVPVLMGLLLSWHSLSDFDIWLHQRVGQDILTGEGFPHTNTFSFTDPEQSWINHEWLFQVIAAISGPSLNNTSNPLNWNLLRALLALTILMFLIVGENFGSFFNKGCKQSWNTWLGIPLLLGIHVLWPRLILRPELFSYLAFVIFVRVLEPCANEKHAPGSDRKFLGSVFVVTLIWAQLHGFSGMAPFMVILAMITAVIAPLLGYKGTVAFRPKTMLMALLLSLLALILTPNGITGITYPLKALGQFQSTGPEISSTISELVPLLDTKESLGQTQLMFKISLVWAGLWILLTWGRISLLRIILWTLAAVAAFSMQRAIGLYAIAFILLHTSLFNQTFSFTGLSKIKMPQGKAIAALGTGLTILLAVLWSVQVVNDGFYLSEGVSRRFGGGVTPAIFPVNIARNLGPECTQRVLSNIDPAGYLLANTRVKLFIDGRTEAYAPKYWSQYHDLKQGSDKSLQIIRDLNPEAIILSLGSGAFLELANVLINGSLWQISDLDESALYFVPAVSGFTPGDNTKWLDNNIYSLESAISRESRSLSPTRLADRYLAVARLWELAQKPRYSLRSNDLGLAAMPNHPILNHNQGTIKMKNRDFASALVHFEKALSCNGRAASSALNAGVCQMNLKKPDLAEKMFELCIRIDNKKFEGWANLGISRLQQGKKKEAQVALERALALRPGEKNLIKMIHDLKN